MTNDMIETSGGIGRFVEFDGNTGKVLVKMDWETVVEYDGADCFPVNVQGN
jgi:hypothetical protein